MIFLKHFFDDVAWTSREKNAFQVSFLIYFKLHMLWTWSTLMLPDEEEKLRSHAVASNSHDLSKILHRELLNVMILRHAKFKKRNKKKSDPVFRREINS
jgi:hypothetical protein